MDVFVLFAFGLLVLGVVGSVLPVLPSGALSLAGVLLHWWATGRPGALVVVVLAITALVALVVDWAAGVIGAGAGGASLRTSALAGLVGLILLIPAGPVGLVVGIAGTVFAAELYGGRTREESLRAAGYAVVGVLGSAIVQALLTGAILAAMVLVYL
ncbi:MAG: DUF456 family protein [Halanaeroarchaeum sp.]